MKLLKQFCSPNVSPTHRAESAVLMKMSEGEAETKMKRSESEGRLLEPALQRRPGLVFDDARGQRLWPERQKIGSSAGPADELDLAAERFGGNIEGLVEKETAWRDQRTLAQIEGLGETE